MLSFFPDFLRIIGSRINVCDHRILLLLELGVYPISL
jgi:hypothetical protein